MFCAFNHLFFFFVSFCLKTLFVFLSIIEVIIVENVWVFRQNFTRVFRCMQVLHQINCPIVKRRHFPASIYCHVMLFQMFRNVSRHWNLFVCHFVIFISAWILKLGIGLSFVISFWFKPPFIFLCFSCVFFVPFIPRSV